MRFDSDFAKLSVAQYASLIVMSYRRLMGPRVAGAQAVPIWVVFDPPYHPGEIVVDDGWVEDAA